MWLGQSTLVTRTPKANGMNDLPRKDRLIVTDEEGHFPAADGQRILKVMPTIVMPTRVIPTRIMQITARCLALWLLPLLLLAAPALQAQNTPSADPKSIPVIDGGLGSCSADFTITDRAGAPVYAATIQVHITYGFLSAHKLDLQAGTNAAGKARFTGLPGVTKHGLFFHASEGEREASAFDDPAVTCKAEFTLALQKKSQ